MVTKKSNAATGSTGKASTRKKTAAAAASSGAKTTKAAGRKTAAKSASKTGAKSTAKAARKPAAGAAAVKPVSVPVQGVTLADAGKVMTKKQLFEAVKAASDGVKGSDVRKVMDAMLDELGAALVRGEALKMQPLGTLKVQRQKSTANADMVVLKLRRKKAGPGGNDPLAEAAE